MSIKIFKIPFSEKFRINLSNKILDWAENQHNQKSEIIKILKGMRSEQRKISEETFQKTRPPKKTELDLISIRLIELFQYEDFKILFENLKRMFSDKDSVGLSNRISKFTNDRKNTLLSGGWMRLGFIYRDKKPIISQPALCAPDLPEEVERIDICLQHILPSSIVITMDIFLNDKVTSNLQKLQTDKYLPQFTMTSFNLHPFFPNISMSISEVKMIEALSKMLRNIRIKVESVIRPYFFGEFSKITSNSPKLPAIEVFGLKGLGQEGNSFIQWANKSSNWWISLGFELFSGTFNNNKLAFNWEHVTLNSHEKIPSRVLVFWNSYFKNLNYRVFGYNERVAIANSMSFFLNGIGTMYSAIKFLQTKVDKVEIFRSSLFKILKKGEYRRQSIAKQISLYDGLQEEKRVTERFLLEYDLSPKNLETRIWNSELKTMKYTNLNTKKAISRNSFLKESGR